MTGSKESLKSSGDADNHSSGALICLGAELSKRTDVEVVNHTKNSLEAIRLIQLGARAPLVNRLTGLEKAVVNRLYRQLMGRHSPPGQMPFSGTWYLQKNMRMLHVNVVWRLYQHFLQWKRSAARLLIDVYESYLNFVRVPVLDLTRTFLVSRLVAVQEWYEQVCDDCAMAYIAPMGGRRGICPVCRGICPVCSHYFNYRCRDCGAALHNHPRGRHRTFCAQCHKNHTVKMVKSGSASSLTSATHGISKIQNTTGSRTRFGIMAWISHW